MHLKPSPEQPLTTSRRRV